MFKLRNEILCIAALIGAVIFSIGGTPLGGTSAQAEATKIVHSSNYLRCVNYTKKVVHECRIDQRRLNQSVRPCGILSKSYGERCLAA
ncbi:MAG: hypothetical protein AB3N20_21160 [Rhizobiaceae bacterium]